VTWATPVPILVFLVLSVLDLGPMCATDMTDVRQKHRLLPSPIRGGVITRSSRNIYDTYHVDTVTALKNIRGRHKMCSSNILSSRQEPQYKNASRMKIICNMQSETNPYIAMISK